MSYCPVPEVRTSASVLRLPPSARAHTPPPCWFTVGLEGVDANAVDCASEPEVTAFMVETTEATVEPTPNGKALVAVPVLVHWAQADVLATTRAAKLTLARIAARIGLSICDTIMPP